MKIGLLTYHHSNNIGAMLQTYATCRALKELGHEVVIVDIRQKEDRRQGLGGLASDMIFFVRNQKYKAFRNTFYPSLTRRYYCVDELRKDPPVVDCLVVGSDQTWNTTISKEIAMAYFLDFGEENIKRISYASSFGVDNWDNKQVINDDVSKSLHKFTSISVRERTALSICRDSFGLEATLVVDPTILFESYPEITGEIEENDEIVCYKLQRNEDFYNNIGIIKNTIGLPVRLLNNSYPVKGFRYTYPPSVSEWIRKIGGSKFVVTDSFHGVVFSLLYNRQFAVIKNHNGRDSRFVDLLTELSLEDRIYESVAQMSGSQSWKELIDYERVNRQLSDLRNKSWLFLENALSYTL